MGVRWTLLLLALGGCSRRPFDAPIREWHARSSSDPLVRVEAEPVWDVPGVIVALYDHQTRWWGSFGCYGLEGGRVVWAADVDEAPSERSIYSVRGAYRDVLGAPLIEVVGQTHMGNGSLYVYELRGRALRRVLETRAYDGHMDGVTFRNRCLDVKVRDHPLEIELSGTIQRWSGEEPEQVVDSRPCRKVFIWDAGRRLFVHDAARRFGFSEPETW